MGVEIRALIGITKIQGLNRKFNMPGVICLRKNNGFFVNKDFESRFLLRIFVAPRDRT